MIKLKEATVSFGKEHQVLALKDVSLEIDKGNWVSILGPSGSGKTTLLNVISGKQPLNSGTCTVDGKTFNTLSEDERQDFRRNTIGFIFQNYRLFNQYTVLENVMLPQLPYQSRNTLETEAIKLLEKVGLNHRVNHLPEQLSGGEKQRVAIARALLNKPKILLCDEPTGNLDIENRDNILSIFSQLNEEGITIVTVTHDHEVAEKSNHQYFLRDGIIEG